MKKILIGILIGIVLTIGVQSLWKLYLINKYSKDSILFDIAKHHVEQSLSGTRVLDVRISPDSKEEVNFVYDELYDVKLTYERNGKIKHFTALYAIYKGTWISPPKSELVVLDDTAEILHIKKSDKVE